MPDTPVSPQAPDADSDLINLLTSTDDLQPGDAKGLEVEGHKLVLINHRGSFYLYRNRCPHRLIPLEWMPDKFLDVEKQYIQCATHGALFRIDDGYCVSGPCTSASLEAVPFEISETCLQIRRSDL